MAINGSVILYHGTDWESALDILNNGLSITNLRRLHQLPTQIGEGFYTTDNVDTAWFFASIAPDTIDRSYTVIEMEMHLEHLESLLEQKSAIRQPIINVQFHGEQIWFHSTVFDFLNENALFRPYAGEIEI